MSFIYVLRIIVKKEETLFFFDSEAGAEKLHYIIKKLLNEKGRENVRFVAEKHEVFSEDSMDEKLTGALLSIIDLG